MQNMHYMYSRFVIFFNIKMKSEKSCNIEGFQIFPQQKIEQMEDR